MEHAAETYDAYQSNHEELRATWITENPDDNRQKIEQTLEDFGMLKNETKVYLYLAEEGLKKAKDICEALKIHRTETYRILHHLEKKGLVYAVLEKPVKFSAMSLDKGIDSLVELQRTKIAMLQNQKDALVNLWMSLPTQKRDVAEKQLFQKIEGEQRIILKAEELVRESRREINLYVTDDYLSELYYGSFFDKLRQFKDKLDITLVTEDTIKSHYFLEKIRWPSEKQHRVSGMSLPSFMISDHHELLIAFNEEEPIKEVGHRRKTKSMAIWTNYHAVVSMLAVLFDKLKPNGQESY